MYVLSDYQQRAELLMALLPAAGDVRPLELMDCMKALMPPEEQVRPSIHFLHAVLSHLPADIRAHCVPFPATGSLLDVAWRTHLQYRSRGNASRDIPDDIPKTAIITPFSLFEFVCMPFGLRNAGSTFQGMMRLRLGRSALYFC